MTGCELEDKHISSPVGVEKTLQYSTDGLLKLRYKGPLDSPTGIKGAMHVLCSVVSLISCDRFEFTVFNAVCCSCTIDNEIISQLCNGHYTVKALFVS